MTEKYTFAQKMRILVTLCCVEPSKGHRVDAVQINQDECMEQFEINYTPRTYILNQINLNLTYFQPPHRHVLRAPPRTFPQ